MSMQALFAALLFLPSSAFAMPPDVATDAWYSSTVSAFVEKGYVSDSQSFRPKDKATRGEFIELIVNALGGMKHADEFALWQKFDDIPRSHPYHDFFEEAGIQGWMKGAGSCYGDHPCYGYPDRPINRAEAAALLMRAFALQAASNAPSFEDNAPDQWFTQHVKEAASLCVLRGDAGARRVRPADTMNRAEMIVMLSRALQREQYPHCSAEARRPPLPAAPKPLQKTQGNDRASSASSHQQPWSSPTASQSQACPDPFVFDLPIDISKATSVLYPGQIRGGDYKAHGGFRFDSSQPDDITVVAPYEARVIAGARYPVEGGAIQYAFDFEHPCGVRYRFMHLLTLTPKFQKIADTFPLPATTDSRTTFLRKPIEVKRGEVVATAIGVPYGGTAGPNTFVDWGVYDYRQLNKAAQDPAWAASHQSDTYQHGVCLFDWISAQDRAKVLALPPADGQSGTASDYCE